MILQTLVHCIDDVLEMTSRLVSPLTCPLSDRLDRALQPGVDTVSWLSSNAGDFVATAERAVTEWQLLMHRASELVEQRILARFRDLERTILCPVSAADEPFTVDQFLNYARVNRTLSWLRKIYCFRIIAEKGVYGRLTTLRRQLKLNVLVVWGNPRARV